jgi:hypothetical protein
VKSSISPQRGDVPGALIAATLASADRSRRARWLGEARSAAAGAGHRRGLGLQHLGPRTVGSYVPTVTKTVLEKYGFAAAAIVTDWASIVGAGIAAHSEPVRLKWPRPGTGAGEAAGAAGASASGARRRGKAGPAAERGPATLVLRVESARALDVQYRAGQIVERINAHFGYRAVAELRIVQGPVVQARAAGKAAPPHPSAVPRLPSQDRGARTAPLDLSAIADDGLRDALARLAVAVGAGSAPPSTRR